MSPSPAAVPDQRSPTAPNPDASNATPRARSNARETRQCDSIESLCRLHASVRQTSQTNLNTQSNHPKDDKPRYFAPTHGPSHHQLTTPHTAGSISLQSSTPQFRSHRDANLRLQSPRHNTLPVP